MQAHAATGRLPAKRLGTPDMLRISIATPPCDSNANDLCHYRASCGALAPLPRGLAPINLLLQPLRLVGLIVLLVKLRGPLDRARRPGDPPRGLLHVTEMDQGSHPSSRAMPIGEFS